MHLHSFNSFETVRQFGRSASIRVVIALLATTAFASPTSLPAQHAASGNGSGTVATPAREAAQFDFLIGQWEVTVMPKVAGLAARIHGSPKYSGVWKAWRILDGFAVEDELRIVDGSGNPNGLSHAMRVFSTADHKWHITGVDAYRSRLSTSTAEWRGSEMVMEGHGTDAQGKAYVIRSRFFKISRDAFSFVKDRSADGGRTWDEGVLRMQAKRIAATAPR